jgi:serine/threonine-protein kinase HipA
MNLDALLTLHAGLSQQGPGSDASTLEAIRRLPPLPRRPRVLDLGCGPGRQTLALVRALQSKVIAVDTQPSFLDQLNQTALQGGLAALVETRNISMDVLDYPPSSFDLIWCEGAAYFLGVGNALKLWRPLLRPGGALAFTEVSWLTPSPPPQAAEFWSNAYPQIKDTEGNLRMATEQGYEVVSTFPLPPADWWNGYYTPLRERIPALRGRAQGWPELATVIEEAEQEINLFEQYGDSYGYVFYILRVPSPPAR